MNADPRWVAALAMACCPWAVFALADCTCFDPDLDDMHRIVDQLLAGGRADD